MKKAKKIFRLALWTLAIVAIVVTMGFVGNSQHNRKCKALIIEVAENDGNYFVDETDIKDMLKSKGKKLVGTPMQDINNGLLEKIINTNPFIENAEVFSTVDGIVHIAAEQRNPVVRVMNTKGEDFYIDENGVFMPVSDKFTAPVIIANGFIFNSYAERKIYRLNSYPMDTISGGLLLEQLFTLANVLRKDTFWNAQTEQLYVNEWQEIEMIPRIGSHKIILGDVSNLEEKLNRLLIFYKKGLNNIGWNTYHTINLKYNNQVVCSKK